MTPRTRPAPHLAVARRTRLVRRGLPVPLAAVVMLSATLPAWAVPVTGFEMPFPCGQAWTGTTRSSHSPSSKAVDWNRADDLGDPVVASAPGVVSTADTVDDSGYGKWVVIEHTDGESTLYAHLSKVAVTVGQSVDQGTLVGNVGDTGNTTGPHLHFEERDNRTDVDPYFHGTKFVFGTSPTSQNCVDVPLAADMVGGDVAELVLFRRGTTSEFIVRRAKREPKVIPFGGSTDEPVLGDWDGDGHGNPGIWSPTTRIFSLATATGTQTIAFGGGGDKPVSGDWDGDGVSEVGVRRPRKSAFRLRTASGSVQTVALGDADDLPVTGDWDGDGVTDLAVFDQATAVFTLRIVDADGLEWTAKVPFGQPGDLPVAGDWDANGKTDLGVWNPSAGVFTQRLAPAPTVAARGTVGIAFGNPR